MAVAIARTVSVSAGDRDGTGVVVSPDGFVVTAAHVVSGQTRVTVAFEDGVEHPARVVRLATKTDLALLRAEATDWPCLPVRDIPAPVGSDALVIGSPGGRALSHSVAKGIVSGYRSDEDRVFVQTDAAINQGNSGGPMVGEDGRVIGIVSFKLVGEGVEGLGFAVASTELPRALDLRWGVESDPDEPDAPPAALDRVLPVVVPGPGVVLDPTTRYAIQRRPRTGHVISGLVLGALGAATVGVTVEQYNRNKVSGMRPVTWDLLRVANGAGWALIGTGGFQVGFGLATASGGGPIVPVEAP